MTEVKMSSGVYFLDDGRDVRIGGSANIEKRVNTHKGSNKNSEIISVIITSPEEWLEEEKEAHTYFENYKLKNSFYDRNKVISMIPHYVNRRILERANLFKKQVKRTGIINTVYGEKSLLSLRKRCDIFPNQYVAFMGKAGTKKGEEPRKFVIEGKTIFVSNKAKELIQSVRRDTKQKISEKLNIPMEDLKGI